MSEKRPRIGAAVLLRDNNKFLLGRRNKVNANGKWVIPGGGVEWGETIEIAAVREFLEETGLSVRIVKFISFREIIATDADYHAVVFFYLCEKISGELVATDDLAEAKFFTVEEIKKMEQTGETVRSVKWVLEDLGVWK